MKIKKKIREWELEKGIRINNPKGFKKMYREHKDIYVSKFTEEQFKAAAKHSNITIKTQKGLQFIFA